MTGAEGTGALARNIVYFARALREAGVPVGPGAVLDAIAAVEAVGLGDREDFRETLHAVFVKTREHASLFDQAFDVFWRRRGFLDKLIAMMSPQAAPGERDAAKPAPGAARIAEALFKPSGETARPPPALELDARLTMSADEILRAKDFAQMSAAEIAEARARIARLALPGDRIFTRRFVADPRGARIDPRRSLRRSLKGGGAVIDLSFRARAERLTPIVALCDISGSMAEYSRLFLHFLHALGRTRRVSTFLFGTRLTNVTRAMRARDPDEALQRRRGGRLVRGNAHRRVAPSFQPRMVAPRARSGRDRASVHGWARARRRRGARPGDGAAAPVVAPPDLAQSAAAL
jgi:hypothetical protein